MTSEVSIMLTPTDSVILSLLIEIEQYRRGVRPSRSEVVREALRTLFSLKLREVLGDERLVAILESYRGVME